MIQELKKSGRLELTLLLSSMARLTPLTAW